MTNEAVGGPLDGLTDAIVVKVLKTLADRITPDMMGPLLNSIIMVAGGLNNQANRQSLADGLRDALRKAAE